VPGEFLAEADFTGWSYKIRPSAPSNKAGAHISWRGTEQGILMLDDLLPKFAGGKGPMTANITFEMPEGWKIASAEKNIGGNTYESADIEKAVFFIGKNWRERKTAGGPDLIISGEWLFKDDAAERMTAEIFAEYKALFGAAPPEKALVLISKFPATEKFGVWEAETRGRTVTILSADMPFEAQSLQLLHEQLRHELFHVWIPNGVNLSGNYDWFYEGFALYQALRAGVKTNRIRFEDFLGTLERAYNIDGMQSKRASLIESSTNRWSGGNTQTYARGLLVAFLCDIAMIRASKGKNSSAGIMRQIYAAHPMSAPRADGNAVVIKALQDHGLISIIDKYITGTENIAWKTDLEAIGIEATEENFLVRLKVKEKPGSRQKAFLEKLGYNNWRKLSRNSR
jgi:predicted metalloprotease with PDZ domain